MPEANSVAKVIKAAYRVVIVDVLALLALYYILQDLQWRTDYAASVHTACRTLCGYSPSFSYGPLTRLFTMDGNGQHLVSPATLDWVQAFSLILIVVNLWFAYSVIKSKKRQDAAAMSPVVTT
jgi:hypothetical protein